ncbi:hypothetical protein RND81_05G036300 [Saponaria officinalis]|uniref:Uncharacterized protein n=1 Tax=Saponaria officinalis TaxID=3572 RepID=A0AAW1KUF8_SAPOF
MMKPLIVKAGISVAFSIAAYIFAKSISKRSDLSIEQSSIRSQKARHEKEPLGDSESFLNLNSTTEDLQNAYISNLENKLVDLESQLEYLQNTKFDMESRYMRYRDLKEKEFVLTKIRNEMLLEKTRAEFMLNEICLAEEENKKIGGLVINFIELLCKFHGLKTENLLLQRKAKNLCRRASHRLMIIRQQKLLIESKNGELINNLKEIERRDYVIQDFEEETKELKEVIDHLQREKIELTNKVDVVEKSDASNIKIEVREDVTKEKHDQTLNELEQLQKDLETQANEITYLKWSNACLRHELMRCHEQQENNKDDTENRLVQFELQDHENGNNENIINCNNSGISKRRRFIKKIKKWVDGGHTDEKEKNEIKCFGKHSAPDEAQDMFVHARMSCSSV